MLSGLLVMSLLAWLQSLVGRVLNNFGVPGLVLLVGGGILAFAATAGLKKFFATPKGIAVIVALFTVVTVVAWFASPKIGLANAGATVAGAVTKKAAGKHKDLVKVAEVRKSNAMASAEMDRAMLTMAGMGGGYSMPLPGGAVVNIPMPHMAMPHAGGLGPVAVGGGTAARTVIAGSAAIGGHQGGTVTLPAAVSSATASPKTAANAAGPAAQAGGSTPAVTTAAASTAKASGQAATPKATKPGGMAATSATASSPGNPKASPAKTSARPALARQPNVPQSGGPDMAQAQPPRRYGLSEAQLAKRHAKQQQQEVAGGLVDEYVAREMHNAIHGTPHVSGTHPGHPGHPGHQAHDSHHQAGPVHHGQMGGMHHGR